MDRSGGGQPVFEIQVNSRHLVLRGVTNLPAALLPT